MEKSVVGEEVHLQCTCRLHEQTASHLQTAKWRGATQIRQQSSTLRIKHLATIQKTNAHILRLFNDSKAEAYLDDAAILCCHGNSLTY